jgi:RNA-directed DNA polymerase
VDAPVPESSKEEATELPATVMPIAKTVPTGPDLSWVEASIWTQRMLSALVNGVKTGTWYSLIDKVYAPAALALAWTNVRANKGAAGVDGQSIERFAAKAGLYLSELSTALRDGTYRAQSVKRVDIPSMRSMAPP